MELAFDYIPENRTIRILDYLPHPRNYNRHPADQVDRLQQSLRTFGQIRSVVVWGDFIVAGHGVIEAAIAEGWTEIRADVLPDDYPEELALAYVAADNELGRLSDPDYAQLATILEESRAYDEDLLAAIGYTDDEYDELLRDIANDPDASNSGRDTQARFDQADELLKKWDVQYGQVWRLGDHRLACGDSTDAGCVQALLGDAIPTMMVTDPPYGVEYDPRWRAEAGVNKNDGKMGTVENDDRDDWSAAWDLFPGDIVYVYHASTSTAVVQNSVLGAGFNARNLIVWVKDRMALSRGDYHWQHELLWYAVREGAPGRRNDDRSQTTVWTIPARDDDGHGHGTQKPIECMERPIRNHTVMTVYDPFVGSGTTIIACENLNRKCFAMELNPAYVAICLERFVEHTAIVPELGDGRPTMDR